MDAKEFLDVLASQGGAIVSSNECSEMEIADAAARGDFYVNEDSLGFIRRTQKWLNLHRDNKLPTEEDIKQYIKDLKFSPALSEETKSLVGINILAFYEWLTGNH